MNNYEGSVPVWKDGVMSWIPRPDLWLVDRTRHVLGKDCPRERWLKFYACGSGLEPKARSEDLVIGICLHRALKGILTGEPGDWPALARDQFMAAFEAGEILIQGDDLLLEINPELALTLALEQANLLYGLVWIFETRTAPKLLEEYEVLALEEEIVWEMGRTEAGDIITMMSTPDGVLRRKSDGLLFALNYKSRKEFVGLLQLEEASLDEQQASEALAVEAKYGEPCGGALTVFFLKGEKRMDDSLGYKRYMTGLIRPYMFQMPGPTSPSQFKWRWDKPGRPPAGWIRVNVWEVMEMCEWFAMVETGGIAPLETDHLANHVVFPELMQWTPTQRREWLLGALDEEVEFMDGLEAITMEPELGPVPFQKRSKNCIRYNALCPYHGICWRGETLQHAVAAGKLVAREPHHKAEGGYDVKD